MRIEQHHQHAQGRQAHELEPEYPRRLGVDALVQHAGQQAEVDLGPGVDAPHRRGAQIHQSWGGGPQYQRLSRQRPRLQAPLQHIDCRDIVKMPLRPVPGHQGGATTIHRDLEPADVKGFQLRHPSALPQHRCDRRLAQQRKQHRKRQVGVKLPLPALQHGHATKYAVGVHTRVIEKPRIHRAVLQNRQVGGVALGRRKR